MGHIWITKHNCHRAHSVLVRELSFQGGVLLWQPFCMLVQHQLNLLGDH